MVYGIPDKSHRGRRRPGLALAVATLATVPVVWLVATLVDTAVLADLFAGAVANPPGLLIALIAFSAAFVLRAFAWTRVLPDLSLGQSWSAIHLALGANHVLPLRMGEPLRILSASRRAGIDWPRATASTVTLRAADLTSLGIIGLAAGLTGLTSWWALATVTVTGCLLVGLGVLWLRRLGRDRVSLPGPAALAATTLAWLLEAVVIFQVAGWAGTGLTFGGAVLVTSAAVLAQVAAFAPGGLGTYEAGGVAALAFLGIEPGTGLAVTLTAHGIKTAYSVISGIIAPWVPAPGMFGRIRLGRFRPTEAAPTPDGPVVLFMPAHNESGTVGSVIRRAPVEVEGRPVVCLIIDDGSSDGTFDEARRAGADVIRLGENQGLGAAVRVGLREAMAHDPAAVAFCDADGEYHPEELDVMVRPILEGRADYVVGSRFEGRIERMLLHRRLGNLALTRLLSWVARRRISDGQSGYRALSARAARSAEIIHDYNYAQVLTLDLLAKGMRYQEVPITYGFRTTGRSFVRLGRYLRSVVPAVYREVNAS